MTASSLTPGFDPTESAPEVYIYNNAGTLQYTYQTAKTQASPTQDFRLTDFTMTAEGNGTYGSATLLLEDNSGALLDTSARRRCLIKREWQIQIYMGKNNAGLARWFYGKIKAATIIRPGTAAQRIQLECVGWGEVLKNKITTIKRNQAKAANGIDLDTTDDSTKIYNLIIDMFADTDHYFDNNVTPIGTFTYSTGAEGICTECTDVSLANVNELGNTFAGFISRVVGAANSEWYVNADRRIVVRDSVNHNSGFFLTNNLSGLDAQNWDSGKIMYLRDSPFSWQDSSYDTMYSWIHAFGHFSPAMGTTEVNPTINASDNLDDKGIDVPFIPAVDNIFKFGVKLTRTGTPATNATLEIRGDDGAGKADDKDIRRTIVIKKEVLAGLGTTASSGTWHEIPISPKLEVEPGEQLHLIFNTYGDVSNTYNVSYATGSGTYYTGGPDTWASTVTGSVAIRVYDAKRLHTSVENANVSARLADEQREKLLPIRADLEEQTVRQSLLIAGSVLGRERRVYENVVATMPDDLIPLASYIRMEDQLTSLDIKATIVAYTVEMHAGDGATTIGASEIKLTLDDIYTV